MSCLDDLAQRDAVRQKIKEGKRMKLKHVRPYQLRDATGNNRPLLIPAGCIETHGPHMAI